MEKTDLKIENGRMVFEPKKEDEPSKVKWARVVCRCTREMQIPYFHIDDVFLNRVDCACTRKAVPYRVYIDPRDA